MEIVGFLKTFCLIVSVFNGKEAVILSFTSKFFV